MLRKGAEATCDPGVLTTYVECRGMLCHGHDSRRSTIAEGELPCTAGWGAEGGMGCEGRAGFAGESLQP